jgi:hypothetical protein
LGGQETSPHDQTTARQIVRRLVSGRRSGRSGGDSSARAAAAAGNDLYRDLSRWVGRDGCNALFSRALAQACAEHPELGHIQLRAQSEPYIEGVGETIIACGEAAAAEALESMLVRLVELLGRLIGDDMATRLIEQSLSASESDRGASDSRREEA